MNYKDVMKSDLVEENVIIYGKEYVLTNQPIIEDGSVSILAECDGKSVILEYELLDASDAECYDVESPVRILDRETLETIYEK